MKKISVDITDSDFKRIDKLIKGGKYAHTSDAIRSAVRKLK